MKNISLVSTFLLLCTILLLAPACEKKITVRVQEPDACIITTLRDQFDKREYSSTYNFLDSSFGFRPCTSPDNQYTYAWDFGDGASATEASPYHKYSKRGKYTVTLVMNNNDHVKDTAQQTVSVLLGQQLLALNNNTTTTPIAIEPIQPTNSYLLLSYNGANGLYSLLQLDSLYKQKSAVNLPASYQLTSMQRTNDGNYAFTGSVSSNAKANELIKLQPDGTVLWNKATGTADVNIYAAQTTDGGYAVIGARPTVVSPGVTNNYTVISKTDQNGNLQWQRTTELDGMMRTRDLCIDADGVVIAGYKASTNAACSGCDSLLIVKLSNSGNLIWRKAVRWGLNTNALYNIKTTALSNGSYAVITQSHTAIYFFSNNGDFIDRKQAPQNIISLVNARDGNLILLQVQGSTGTRLRISKLSMDAFEKWYRNDEGREPVVNGYSCCAVTYPIAIAPARTGGYIVLGDRIPSLQTNIRHQALVMEVDEDGQLK